MSGGAECQARFLLRIGAAYGYRQVYERRKSGNAKSAAKFVLYPHGV